MTTIFKWSAKNIDLTAEIVDNQIVWQMKGIPEVQTEITDKPAKKPRGLAAVSPERRSEIGRMGGQASQASGKGHRFTSESAAIAGHKGGTIAQQRGTAHNFTPEEASAAGKIGGKQPKRKRNVDNTTETD